PALALLLACTLPALAAPPAMQHVADLDAVNLAPAGSASVLLAPKLLIWPQLQKDPDGITLLVPSEAARKLYITEPQYSIGMVFGIAEGDWAVFTEQPATPSDTGAQRLVAIYLPRGSVSKWDLTGPLDNRWAYAPRLFGFPAQDGNSFHWLILP